MDNVTHAYSTVPVLENVSFELRGGAIQGLIGQNGAGKSTLLKVLTGAVSPLSGTVTIDGQPVNFAGPRDAQAAGIAIVHQDVQAFPELSVALNVYGVNQTFPRRTGVPTIAWKAIREDVAELLGELDLDLDPAALFGSLDTAERRLVSIARALARDPQFLILDEPTAALEPSSSARVMAVMHRLRDQGIGVCFVSHRLDEVAQVSDSITVLRNGQVVSSLPNTHSPDELASLMIGEVNTDHVSPQSDRSTRNDRRSSGGPGIEVSAKLRPWTSEISLTARRGQLIGLTGLLGAGAKAFVRRIAGATAAGSRVKIGDAAAVGIHSRSKALRLGIGYVPENRPVEGLIPEQTVSSNMVLSNLQRVSLGSVLLNRSAIRAVRDEYVRALSIEMPSSDPPIASLSGGNQQKVIIARALHADPIVLAIVEPTQGVDVQSRAQIHRLLRAYVDGGGIAFVASTDIDELADIADEIAVFRHGEITGMVTPDGDLGTRASLIAALDLEDDTPSGASNSAEVN